MAGSPSCPSDNAQAVDQSSFWNSNGVDWDAHRVGWVISGSCAAAVRRRMPHQSVLNLMRELLDRYNFRCDCDTALPVSSTGMLSLCRSGLYIVFTDTTRIERNNVKCECMLHRRILKSLHEPTTCCVSLRVLYMPPVYALISFFSYRFFRDYTYYDLIETGERYWAVFRSWLLLTDPYSLRGEFCPSEVYPKAVFRRLTIPRKVRDA